VRLIRRLRRAHDEERGLTLVEMTITIMLFALVMTVIMKGFMSFQSLATGEDLRLQNLDEARLIMDAVSKDVRTATMLTAGTSPFIVADALHVTFYANLNTTTGPKKIDLSIDSTVPTAPVLVEKVTASDPGSNPPTYTTLTPTTRLVGKYVTNSTSLPLFTFYDQAGTLLTTPLSSADLLAVRQVGINLSVRKSVNQYLPATTITTRVSLPNIFYNVQESPSP
jgi:type II secretory pathway pseudopilin PulG